MGGQEEEEEEELVNRPGQEKRGRDWETLFATSLAILLITYTPLSSIVSFKFANIFLKKWLKYNEKNNYFGV